MLNMFKFPAILLGIFRYFKAEIDLILADLKLNAKGQFTHRQHDTTVHYPGEKNGGESASGKGALKARSA